jgi:hypothetical protein
MTELAQTLEAATLAGHEVAELMAAVKVVVRRAEARLRAFADRDDRHHAGQLRSLVAEVGELYGLSVALGNVAVGLTATERARLAVALDAFVRRQRDAEAGATLRAATEQTLKMFEQTEQAAMQVELHALRHMESLREAALRADAPPDVIGLAEGLLERARRRPAAGG